MEMVLARMPATLQLAGLAFAIALVAAFAGLLRTGLGAVLGTIGTLLVMPIGSNRYRRRAASRVPFP